MYPNIFTHTPVDTEDILMFGYEKIIITHNLEIVLYIGMKGNQKMDKNLIFVSRGPCFVY
jgi:hypothetical protein